MSMNMKVWWFFRRIERQLKIFALWVFFYRFTFRVSLFKTFGLFKGSPDVCHGPQVGKWPWWKLFTVVSYNTELHPPSLGWNIWIYTRRSGEVRESSGRKYQNVGRLIEVSIDRRARTKDLEMWL